MGTKIKLMLFAIALISFSCSKVESEMNSGLLNGVWVNSATMTDTLDFNVNPGFTKSTNLFQLKRGTEVRRGQTMPKIGSGYYEYLIDGEKINLRGVLIDIHNNKDYIFKLNPDNKSLEIGAFAPFESGLSVNKFIRVD